MGLIDLIGGLFGGGGGGAGASVTYGVTSTVQGGDRPVGLVSTLQGGDRPIVVDVGLDDVNLDAGLDDINVDVGGTGTPLHSIAELRTPNTFRSASELGIAFTRPIVSEIDSKLDVEPVQVDLCLDVGLTKLPKACIQQPYSSRFGVTVFGTEVVGFNWSGRSEVIIDELDERPHVELGHGHGEHGRGHGEHGRGHGEHGRGHGGGRHEPTIEPGDDGGLHVRLD